MTRAPPLPRGAEAPVDIVLLMKEPEAAFCAAALKRYNKRLSLARAETLQDIQDIRGKVGGVGRLVAFSTSVVVPGSMLPLFHGGAFNFHPGPPEYPGNRPSAFACYHQENQFGVTFHRMIASVDAGEILDCERFSAKGLNTASAFALQAYQSLARLFLRNAAALANPKAVLAGNGEVWSGKKTKMSDYDAMRRVPRNISPDDLYLRLRSFLGVYTPIWIEFD